jgi:DNA polymerase/3'-5' exonuclease PolX
MFELTHLMNKYKNNDIYRYNAYKNAIYNFDNKKYDKLTSHMKNKINKIINKNFFKINKKTQNNTSQKKILFTEKKKNINNKKTRVEVEKIFLIIKKLLKKYQLILAGSYRRGKQYMGDIDIIIFSRNIDDVIKKLKLSKYFNKIIVGGNKKITIIFKNTFVDFRFFDIKHKPFALLYFTGSAKFNLSLRYKAKLLGYKLNEYGLFDRKKNIPITNINGKKFKTEKDVLNFLQMDEKYINPHNRN